MKKKIKPWGYEKLVELNKNYLVKILFMKKNHRCSLQYHNKKKETILVLNGKLQIELQNKYKKKIIITKKTLIKNQSITIKPRQIHRMKGITNCLYMEASTPQNKDVVRLADDYKRV